MKNSRIRAAILFLLSISFNSFAINLQYYENNDVNADLKDLGIDPESANVISLKDEFNAHNAYSLIQSQLNFGYRVPGTSANKQCALWISSLMDTYGSSEIFNYSIHGTNCTNILGKVNRGDSREIIIFAAHYDSRNVAEKDPDSNNRYSPIPGANDGASGVAVILEIARVLSYFLTQTRMDYEYWFMFFDAEDQGLNNGIYGIDGWDWCEGSKWMADEMKVNPGRFFDEGQSIDSIQAFFLFDMVGGEGLRFTPVSPYDDDLYEKIFETGRELGYDGAFPQGLAAVSVVDDHVYFSQLNIPVFDLIIPFWDNSLQWHYHHTLEDDLSHISIESLNITGRTMLDVVQKYYFISRDSDLNPSEETSDWEADSDNSGFMSLWNNSFTFRYIIILFSSMIGLIIVIKLYYSIRLKKMARDGTS